MIAIIAMAFVMITGAVHDARSPASIESQMEEQKVITGDESAVIVVRPSPMPSPKVRMK